MKIVLCGGGTAGHINPAIAIAEEIKRQDQTSEIMFIGRDMGKENRLVEKTNIKIKTIKVSGLKRSLSPQNIKIVHDAIKAKQTAKKILSEFSPDIVLGTGGYVCWPVLKAAKELGIKTAIHESNVSPGLVTRLLSPSCDLVLLNHIESSAKLFTKGRMVVVGNPLRSDFSRITRTEARHSLGLQSHEILIVSFGGSGGSEKMNDVILELIEKYSSKENDIKHIHATGEKYFNKQESLKYSTKENGCKIVPYIDDMPRLLKASDIVICRCGSVTLSEISAAGVAAILIPSPNVSNNHQCKNAKKFEDKNAAVVLDEKTLDFESLKNCVFHLKSDKIERKNRAKTILHLSTPDAAKRVTNELFLLTNPAKKAAL